MYDVIVVGCGTVGLTVANLLANLGLKIALIEKKSHLNSVANAVGVNDECLDVWQKCGILEQIQNFIGFNESGRVILKYLDESKREIFSIKQSFGLSKKPKGVVFLQNKIDQILLKNLEGRVEVIFDETLISLAQKQDFIKIRTAKKTYKTKYLIGADGKDSGVRKLIGIGFRKFSESKDEWLILNLLSRDRGHQKDFVEVNCGARSLVSCPLPQNFHRIEVSLKKDETDLIADEVKIRALIANYLDFKNYEIVDKFKIRFVTGIAEKYYLNRVVLCGDAAHSTSPFASAGLVFGIKDAAVLYEIFKRKEIDFSLYQKRRYRSQIRVLRLAIILENLMRPNEYFKKIIFASLRLFSKSAFLLKQISIRP